MLLAYVWYPVRKRKASGFSLDNASKATLLTSAPHDRYRSLSKISEPHKKSDIVQLDHASRSPDGREMVLAYCYSEDGSIRYEAEVHESELVKCRGSHKSLIRMLCRLSTCW